MLLTKDDKDVLAGKEGKAAQKSMEILVALGEIFGAERMINVSSVQVAGVSYHNLGDAGLEFLEDLARDGKVKVLTTLNPAGMDLENWKNLGISPEFAEKQEKVINAFRKLGIITTCTCTPYLIGNLPRFGESVAWSESSAVCFANSVLGARTNKEGGPSALAAAITGKTPYYGFHLDKNREPEIVVEVIQPKNEMEFGALALAIGKKVGKKIPIIKGIKEASLDELKSFCASFATYSSTILFYMDGITPGKFLSNPKEVIKVTGNDLEEAIKFLNDEGEVDFVSVGCPHCSLNELDKVARLLKGKKVRKETWVCTARPTKRIADSMGVTKIIEDSGAKFACDTCLAVAPLKGRFKVIATNSAKGCYYGRGSNGFKTKFLTLEGCIKEALK